MSEFCERCGRVPAAVVTIRRSEAKVLAWQQHVLTAPLCREHGEELVRSWTRRTLIQGWWNHRSWLPSARALLGNRAARRALALLPDPYAVPPGRSDDEPFPEHLGFGPAAFEPRAAYPVHAGLDARALFQSRPTFGDRREPRSPAPGSGD